MANDEEFLDLCEKGRNASSLDEKIACFEQAVRIEPDIWVYCDLIKLYKRKGELDKAVECLNKIIELFDTNDIGRIEAYDELASVYKQKKEFDKAIECYKKIIEIRPTDSLAYSELVSLYRSLGRYEEAINCLKQKREVFPADAKEIKKIIRSLRKKRKRGENKL